MAEPDPVAVALESALTPTTAEAAAEVDAWTKAMAARTVNGWDFTSVGPAPDFPRLRLRSLRTLVAHAYATGEPCDGERCEDGGAAHCHKCAEVEADELLKERDRLRAELAELRGQIARRIEATPHPCQELDGAYCPCADLQREQDAAIARGDAAVAESRPV